MYTKIEYLEAIKWHFEIATDKAEKFYKECLLAGNILFLDSLVDGFVRNAQKLSEKFSCQKRI